jgi:predicted transcriptional regulator
MRRSTICILDDEDYELAEAIQKAGFQRISASILVFLMRMPGPRSSREIQKGTGKIQPEVSIHIRTLIEKGLVRKEEIKTPGKGAPHYVYSLAMSPADLLGTIETELEAKLSEEQTRVASLCMKLREAKKSMEG